MSSRKSIVQTLRLASLERRSQRAARRRLEAELATFTSNDDQAELYALIAQQPDSDASAVSDILDSQRYGLRRSSSSVLAPTAA